jgi:hypothetical protein
MASSLVEYSSWLIPGAAKSVESVPSAHIRSYIVPVSFNNTVNREMTTPQDKISHPS